MQSSEPSMLDTLVQINRQITDRMAAQLLAIHVHPEYYDIFVANLVEEGCTKRNADTRPLVERFGDIPIFTDFRVPIGEIKYVFAGDESQSVGAAVAVIPQGYKIIGYDLGKGESHDA